MNTPKLQFQYEALDFAGRRHLGAVESCHADGALGQLEKRGLKVVRIELIKSTTVPFLEVVSDSTERQPATLGAATTVALASHIAELSLAQLPLETGLAALAEEMPSAKLRTSMKHVAQSLSLGMPLDEALRSAGAPPYVQAVVRAGQRSGRIGETLERYSGSNEGFQRTMPLVWSTLISVMLSFTLWCVPLGVLLFHVLPGFMEVLNGFGVELPWLTVAVANVSTAIMNYWYLFAGASLLVLGLLAVLFVGRMNSSRITRGLHRIPGIGIVVRSLALSRFSILVSVLVDCQVPLPESLKLAGDASSDLAIQEDAHLLARQISDGHVETEKFWRKRSLKPGFVLAFQNAHGVEALVDGMRAIAQVYASRVRLGLMILATLFPPVMFVTLGIATGTIVLAIYWPFFELLRRLA